MKHAISRSPARSASSLGWIAALLFALSGCGHSTQDSVDATVGDSAVRANADVEATGAPDATSTEPDAVALARDAMLERADAGAADAVRSTADADRRETIAVASEDAVPERADTLAADSTPPPRADATFRRDTSSRADAVVPDTLVEEPDVEALPCQVGSEPATMGRLTPLELKTILDGSEDPYLINVKGSSIANIPGTDAVLASDVPGIEALVDGNLCADIILYCRSGSTSQTVGKQLIAKGYLRVRDLEGGITAWTAAGYPTE